MGKAAAAVVAIRPSRPSGADPLAELFERRADLQDEHVRLGLVHRTYLDAHPDPQTPRNPDPYFPPPVGSNSQGGPAPMMPKR